MRPQILLEFCNQNVGGIKNVTSAAGFDGLQLGGLQFAFYSDMPDFHRYDRSFSL